jgi:DNA-binding winged helix-turn-helix (wHTH) protein
VHIRFGPFTVDSRTRQLLRAQHEIHLSPKAFDLLCLLLERRPAVVQKEELHAQIWPATYVGDANLNVLIGEIRRTLGDDAQRPLFIRTVHRIGFAFCGEAAVLDAPPAPAAAMPVWLVWKERTFRLSEGDNVIGRDPQCAVWLDAAGVSRQHARIRVDTKSQHAALADLGSTNGTFLRGTPVVGHAELADGDVIAIGPVELTFRAWTDRLQKTERIKK